VDSITQKLAKVSELDSIQGAYKAGERVILTTAVRVPTDL
jgi:hypothetical protein